MASWEAIKVVAIDVVAVAREPVSWYTFGVGPTCRWGGEISSPSTGACGVSEIMVCGAACPAFLGGVRASARTWGAPFASMEQREGAARLWRRRRMPSWSMWCRVDHVSGYFHVKLTEGSRTYFGFEWGSVYYVCNVLNFGWKPAPYMYIRRSPGRWPGSFAALPSGTCTSWTILWGRHSSGWGPRRGTTIVGCQRELRPLSRFRSWLPSVTSSIRQSQFWSRRLSCDGWGCW